MFWRKKKPPTHILKDVMRDDMHRRAQKAEGTLERTTFWLECIKTRSSRDGDQCIASLAEAALKEIRRTTTHGGLT